MKKIMIICQCATNKGDRAIAEYLINQLLEDDVSITLSTTVPELWKDIESDRVSVIGMGYRKLFPKVKNNFLNKLFHEVTYRYYKYFIYPKLLRNGRKKRIERLSKRFIAQLQEADLVIVTGGHHITSIRNHNALFAITYDIALASLYSKRYILWSQTIGPLTFDDSRVEKLFADIIKKADAVFIRDENSRQCLQELVKDEQGNVLKSYDSVFGFGNRSYLDYADRENKVGISIFNGLKKARNIYPEIAKVLDHFVRNGYSVEFFRMEHNAEELEDIQKVIDLMETKGEVQIFPFEVNAQAHLKEVASCKYFIGYKTHSVIMALTTATPLLGICYHQKTRDFMADYGLVEYAIDDEVFSCGEAITVAEKLVQNAEEINKVMAEKSKTIASCMEADLKGAITNAVSKR